MNTDFRKVCLWDALCADSPFKKITVLAVVELNYAEEKT